MRNIKHFIFILFFLSTVPFLYGQSTLKELISRIESETDYSFMFNSMVDLDTKIPTYVKSENIKDIIAKALAGKNISYEISGKQIILKSTKNASQDASRKITGIVTDSDEQPVVGASVVVLGTTTGTVTGIDGTFSLSIPEDKPVRLKFSYLGYISQEIEVVKATSLTVRMLEDNRLLDEVVVVGYGSLKKGEITSSITSIKPEDFVKGAITNPQQLIRGKVAGLAINTTSGDPNNPGIQIMLRGVSNLSGNQQPLIVVDGIPGGSLSTIPPDDIQSIEVLKDGSAAAIYGTRGTNGVLLITTKKGYTSGNKISVNYHGYLSYETISNRIKTLNANEFLNIPEKTGGKGLQQVLDGGAQVDWFKEISRSPVNHVHNVSFQGGNEISNFTATVNYQSTDGILKNSDKEQLIAKISANHAIWDDRLRFSVNASNTFATVNSVNSNVYFNSLIVNPTQPIKDDSGNYIFFQDANNPVQEVNEKLSNSEWNHTLLNGKISFEVIKDLNLNVLGGFQRTTNVGGSFATYDYFEGNQKHGEVWRNESDTQLRTLELLADYSLNIDTKHQFIFLAGYSYQDYIWKGFNMYNYDYPTELLSYNRPDLGLALKEGNASMGGYKAKTKLISFFGRINYSYQNKYILAASLRREGSTKFGPNNKWGLFPAVSAGWRISAEDFMKGVTAINDLKLRAGYGVTGAEPKDPYLSINKYDFTNPILSEGEYIWSVGPTSKHNPDLKWETKHEINIGLDFSLLKNRLSGAVDFYNRTTKDLLYVYNIPVPPNLVPQIWANVGSISNTGFEVTLEGIVIKNKDFSWVVSANSSHNKNKLLKLSNEMYKRDFLETGSTGHPIQKLTHIVKEDMPVGNFYGWKSTGISEDGKTWITTTPYGENENREVLGNGIPKVFAGLTTTFNYREFDLTLAFRGAFLFQILNKYRMLQETFSKGGNANYSETVFDHPYGSDTYYSGVPAYVSYYIEDGDYLKVDNATLGYSFKLKDKKWLKSARIYISGLNLYTFTKYKGIDPEVNFMGLSPGIDDIWTMYPTTRVMSFGVQLGL